MKLKARQDVIIKIMGEAVAHLPDATIAFYTITSAKPDARPALSHGLGKIEQEADTRFRKLIRKVAATFITPHDRDNLYRMLEALDGVIDSLDHAGQLIVDFEMTALPPEFVANAKELVGMSEVARDGVDLIKKPNRTNKMEKTLYEISRHNNSLGLGYRKVLADALKPGSDPIEAVKLKTLADSVEHVASLIDAFTRTLAVVAIKET